MRPPKRKKLEHRRHKNGAWRNCTPNYIVTLQLQEFSTVVSAFRWRPDYKELLFAPSSVDQKRCLPIGAQAASASDFKDQDAGLSPSGQAAKPTGTAVCREVPA
jgi:hypothetical protein